MKSATTPEPNVEPQHSESYPVTKSPDQLFKEPDAVDFDHDEIVAPPRACIGGSSSTRFPGLVFTRITENLSSTCTNSFDEESHGTCTNSHDRGSSLNKDLKISGGLGAASIIL